MSPNRSLGCCKLKCDAPPLKNHVLKKNIILLQSCTKINSLLIHIMLICDLPQINMFYTKTLISCFLTILYQFLEKIFDLKHKFKKGPIFLQYIQISQKSDMLKTRPLISTNQIFTQIEQPPKKWSFFLKFHFLYFKFDPLE